MGNIQQSNASPENAIRRTSMLAQVVLAIGIVGIVGGAMKMQAMNVDITIDDITGPDALSAQLDYQGSLSNGTPAQQALAKEHMEKAIAAQIDLRRRQSVIRTGRTVYCVAIGGWLVLMLGLGTRYFLLRARLQTRRDRGQCLDCGYDLRGSDGRCPECGTFANFLHPF